jgi:hypothetical protein
MHFLKKSKIASIVLSATILITSTMPINVFAMENIDAESIQIQDNSNLTLDEPLPLPQESDYLNMPQARNLATKICKEAIEYIIKHPKNAEKVVEKVAGKTVAKNFAKHYGKVCSGLKPLLKWSNIPYQALYDASFRALVNAGVSRSVASNIALAIKEGASWFF